MPEGWIAFFIMLLGAFYALRIAWHFVGTGGKSVFWTCFLYLGTNVLYDTLDAGETAEDCTYFLHYALCALGMGINLVGSIATNMTWVS